MYPQAVCEWNNADYNYLLSGVQTKALMFSRGCVCRVRKTTILCRVNFLSKFVCFLLLFFARIVWSFFTSNSHTCGASFPAGSRLLYFFLPVLYFCSPPLFSEVVLSVTDVCEFCVLR